MIIDDYIEWLRVSRNVQLSIRRNTGESRTTRWNDSLVADCALCKQERSRAFAGDADANRRNCGARRILAYEPDFLDQNNCLQELVENGSQ